VNEGRYGDLFGFLRELVVSVRPPDSGSGATGSSQQAQHRAKLDQIQNRMKGALFSGKTSAFEHLSTYRMVVRGMQLTPKEKCEGFVWSLAPSARNTWEQEVTPWLDTQTVWDEDTWTRFQTRFVQMYEGKADIKAQFKLEETKWQEGQLMIDHCSTIKMLAKIAYPKQGEEFWVAKALNSIPRHLAEKVRFKYDFEGITWDQMTKVLTQIGPTERKLEDQEEKPASKQKQQSQGGGGRSQQQQTKFRPGPPLPPYFKNQNQQQQQQPVRFSSNLVQGQEEEDEEEEEMETGDEETEVPPEAQGWDDAGLTPEQMEMMQTFQAFLTGDQQYQQQSKPNAQYQQQGDGKQQSSGPGRQENRGYRGGNQSGSNTNPNWQKGDNRQQNSNRQQGSNWQRQHQQQSSGSFGKPGGNHYSFNLDEEGMKYLKSVLNLGGASSTPRDKSQDTCRKCGEKGHWENDAQCPQAAGDKSSGNGSSSK
jgi:hypothetical protein